MKSIKAKLIANELTQATASVFCASASFSILNNSKYYIFPGFCDVHVHFREPGFSYKETIKTGSMSAARGGYTTVCTMPNLNPVPDSAENILRQIEIINRDSVINILPYASITVNQEGKKLSKFDELSKLCFAFSDDGKGIQTKELMKEAMIAAKKMDKIIVAHCEDNSLLGGGYIHDGEYCKVNGHKGICSESEYGPIARDIELIKETGCPYHVCHVSCKESVEIIRKAKEEGVDITCETAPHYLILDDSYLQDDGKFKMNPPLRSRNDRLALIEGIKDGTIDMIATDHAPHSKEEKSKGLSKSSFGVVGLETSFASLYTHLVLKNIVSLERLIDLLAINPRKRFNIPFDNSFTVWNLEKKKKVNSTEFLSMGKSTPFEGLDFYGECIQTVYENDIVYSVV